MERIVILTVSIVLCSAGLARAGFLDAFDKASQAVQNTTNRIERTQSTVERAGKVVKIPKKEKVEQAAEDQPAPKTQTGSLSAKDRAAIEKAKRAWVAGFKSEDWDTLVDQYTDDAVVLPPDEAIVTGREAIRAYFATEGQGRSDDWCGCVGI